MRAHPASLCLALLPVFAAGQAWAQGAPYLPRSEAVVLQAVPPAADPAIRRVEALRTRVAADRGDLAAAEELARAYIDFGRRVGDAHYAGYAEAVIAPFLARAVPPAGALVIQATILQYRHEFAKARELLGKAVAQQPANAQAWLTLATLDLVQGDYRAAAAHCAQVAKHGGYSLGLACAASLRLHTGQAAQATALLSPLDGDAPGVTPEFKAWIQGLLAEAAERVGDWKRAEAHYRKALRDAPGDNFLLVAYADLLLDRGREREVLDLLAAYSDSDTAFLRLALAHAALATPEAARYRWTMAARFEGYAQRGSEVFGREHARYLLHVARQPRSALVAAQRNWAVQREPWDARILLEAAAAAGEPAAAEPVIAFLAQSGFTDPHIDTLVRMLAGRAKGRPWS